MYLVGHHGYGNQSVAAIAYRAVLGELYLPENDDRPDDEHNRNRELQHDQHFAWHRSQPPYTERPFQYLYRFERRQVECRVTAGDQTGDKAKANSGDPKPGLFQGMVICLSATWLKNERLNCTSSNETAKASNTQSNDSLKNW